MSGSGRHFSGLERAAMVGDRLNPIAFASRHTRRHTLAEEQQVKQDLDKLQKGISAVGFIDQTGVADLLNAFESLLRAVQEPEVAGTHLRNAGVSMIGAIPVLGSIGVLGKSYAAASKAAKAGGAMPEVAGRSAASGLARVTRAGGRLVEKRPGLALALAHGIYQTAKSIVGRKDTPRTRADVFRDVSGTALRSAVTAGGLASMEDDPLAKAIGGWGWAMPKRGHEVWSTSDASYGSYSGPGGVQSYSPGASFASRPSRSRSFMRRAASNFYHNSPLAWSGAVMGAEAGAASWIVRHSPTAMMWKGTRGLSHFAARTGVMGPLAAANAGGWYGSPANVGATIKSFGEGLAKATAASIAFVASLRLANMGTLAFQSRYAMYGGTMAGAYGRYQADELRRNIRMANTIGGSYAGLSADASKLEDKTLPYRALASNVNNRFLQGLSKIGHVGIGIAEDAANSLGEHLFGLTHAVDRLNELLGGSPTDRLPPYVSLMHDIAKSKFVNGPTARPR